MRVVCDGGEVAQDSGHRLQDGSRIFGPGLVNPVVAELATAGGAAKPRAPVSGRSRLCRRTSSAGQVVKGATDISDDQNSGARRMTRLYGWLSLKADSSGTRRRYVTAGWRSEPPMLPSITIARRP